MTRTVRLLGITDALLNVLLQGKQYFPTAKEKGLVHEVVDTPEEMLAAPAPSSTPTRSRSSPGTSRATGSPAAPRRIQVRRQPARFPRQLEEADRGAPYPAQRNILAAAVEGSQVDFELAQVIEARYFVELVTGQISKNMIQAFFFDLQAVNAGAAGPRASSPARSARSRSSAPG